MIRLLLVLALGPAFVFADEPASKPKEITFVVSGNEDFTMKVFGFAQARLQMDDNHAGTDVQNYDVPLARLGFKGTAFTPNLSYFMVLQAGTLPDANNDARLIDIGMRYRFTDQANVKVGRFLLPYSRQFYVHPGELLFSDISAADEAFALPRSTGVEFFGKWRKLSYHLASVNSVRPLVGASGQKNQDNHLAWIARAEYDILGAHDYIETLENGEQSLSVGLAAATNPIAAASAAQNANAGEESESLTADIGWRCQRTSAQAAYYTRTTKKSSTGAKNASDKGYYAQASYYVIPKTELAYRYSHIDFDYARNAGVNGDTDENSLGVNYYFNKHNLKLQTDYAWLRTTPFTGDAYEDKRFRLLGQFMF